jgi:hypothetical protein
VGDVAYTIGNVHSYDKALTEPDTVKIGARLDEEPPYAGGCVWRTAEEATAFIQEHGSELGFDAAVYGLLLPTGWEVDVSPEPDPTDGVHRLLHDARILAKVATPG